MPELLAKETTAPLVAELREKRVEVETSAGKMSSRRTKARHDDIRHWQRRERGKRRSRGSSKACLFYVLRGLAGAAESPGRLRKSARVVRSRAVGWAVVVG